MKNAHICSFGALEFTENPTFSVNWATAHIFQNISRSIRFTIKPFEMWGPQMYTPRRFFCFVNILHENFFKSTKSCATSRFWEFCPEYHMTGILNSWIYHRTTKGASNSHKIILKSFLNSFYGSEKRPSLWKMNLVSREQLTSKSGITYTLSGHQNDWRTTKFVHISAQEVHFCYKITLTLYFSRYHMTNAFLEQTLTVSDSPDPYTQAFFLFLW